MKKLSPELKLYFLRRRRKLERRRANRRGRRAFRFENGGSVPHSVYKTEITAPEVLSFRRNYDKTAQFIEEIREHAIRQQKPCHIDFRSLRDVGPGAALVLTSELDRWRRLQDIRLRVDGRRGWNKDVRRLLQQMGLFDVLNVANPPQITMVVHDETFIKFRSENTVLGEKSKELTMAIEHVAGPIVKKRKRHLYDGLTEAMTNVVHHAYPEAGEYETQPIKNQWWMAGSFNAATRRLVVLFFDQGVGIPASLPRTHPIERIAGLLSTLSLVDDDGSRIKAAMELGRTKTGQRHRGTGLHQIRYFADLVGNGKLRILSGRGEYVYISSPAVGEEQEHLRQLPRSIGGTLIQWEGTI